MIGRFIRALLSFVIGLTQHLRRTKPNDLTKDGAWSWFSDPRAIVVGPAIYTGWVKSNGTIEAARLHCSTQIIETSRLYGRLEKDDHNNPAFVATAGGRILAMYTSHSKKDLFVNTLEDYEKNFAFDKPIRINPINAEELSKFPHETITYANPFLLENEDRLYCFGRWTGYKPNIMWSADDGTTWSKSKVFIASEPFDKYNRPYCKYFSDGKSKIHIVFTDGHPRNEPTNSVYYVRFENEKFYDASGRIISDLESIPFQPKDTSIIYRSNETKGRAWIADVGQCEQDYPVVLYTKSPSENNHEYWYGRYTKDGWINRKICDGGGWFPQTKKGQKERESHYFGNMSVHPANANVIYLSRQINQVFEIERWETADLGNSWQVEPLTQNSEYDNVRPFVPRALQANQDEVVLWMENRKYVHFTNFMTAIKYYIRPLGNTSSKTNGSK